MLAGARRQVDYRRHRPRCSTASRTTPRRPRFQASRRAEGLKQASRSATRAPSTGSATVAIGFQAAHAPYS